MPGVMPTNHHLPRERASSGVEDAIINRATFDAIFGGWSSFHDQALLAIRLTTRGPGAPALEADFRVDADYKRRPDGAYEAGSVYRVTLRFHRIAEVRLSEFLAENIVGELRLSPGGAPESGHAVEVTLEAIPGCGGDLRCLCAAVEVLAVDGPYPPTA
jgi:hypothetical protein